MNWPTSQDYNEAVQDAANNFADETMQRGEVVVNALGLPVPRSGNFADVYQFKDGDGRLWALKCFTRKIAGLRERYAKIDEHLAKYKLPFTVGFKYMDQGICVKGEWFPLLKMEWVEGITLNDFVAENLTKPHYLHALMQMWAKLAGRLRDANMAHADLQHGNVLLVPGATPQKLGLKLIDYDGMWVPALSEYHSGEIGHPNFQHPLRLKDRLYNGDVDRFPHLVVAAGLRAALVGGKTIWDRFDNSDNLIFKEADLRDPARATVFKSLWDLNDPILRTLVGHIALASKQPLRKTPWLDDLLFAEGGPKLTVEDERQVCALLGVTQQPVATNTSRAPAKVEQTFNVFEFQHDDDHGGSPAPKNVRRLTTTSAKKTKQAEKKSLLPFLIGGGVFALLLIVGVIVALSLGGKKKEEPTEVVQNKEVSKAKLPNRDPIPKKEPEEVNPPPKKKPSVPVPPNVPMAAAMGVAVPSGGQDYFFIRQGDPHLYVTVEGSARKAREIGRQRKPLQTLAVSSDGSRAITGAEDGEIRIWSLSNREVVGTPVPPPMKDNPAVPVVAKMLKTKVQGPTKMDGFKRAYEFTLYREGLVIRDLDSNKEVTLHPTTGIKEADPAFNGLFSYDRLAKAYGTPLSLPTDVFDGELKVVLCQRGFFLNQTGTTRDYNMSSGRALFDAGPPVPVPPAIELPKKDPAADLKNMKNRVYGPMKILGYQYTLYREGLFVADLKTDKIAVVSAGRVLTEAKGPFKDLIGQPEPSPFRQPVSEAVELFDGMLVVQLFRRGLIMQAKGNPQIYRFNAGENANIGSDGEQPPATNPRPEPNDFTTKNHDGPVIACAFSADGLRAVTVGKDHCLCEWDVVGSKLIRKFNVPESCSVAYLPDGKSVILGTVVEGAGVWDLGGERRVTELPGHPAAVRSVCVSPSGTLAWTGSEDGTIRTWSLNDFKPTNAVVPSDIAGLRALAVAPNGRLLACLVADGSVCLFDTRTGRLAGRHEENKSVQALTFFRDNELIIARDPYPTKLNLDVKDGRTPPVAPK